MTKIEFLVDENVLGLTGIWNLWTSDLIGDSVDLVDKADSKFSFLR